MEILWGIPVVLAVLGLAAFFFVRRGGRRREMSRAGLHRRASGEAGRLRAFVDERESGRPERDSVVRDHDLPSRRVTLHDEATVEEYLREHLDEVAEIRRQARDHGVRDDALDSVYDAPENVADLRTLSTALSEVARRLREGR